MNGTISRVVWSTVTLHPHCAAAAAGIVTWLPGFQQRRAANMDTEEELEEGQAQLVAKKKIQLLLYGDTLDSGMTTLNCKMCSVKHAKLKSLRPIYINTWNTTKKNTKNAFKWKPNKVTGKIQLKNAWNDHNNEQLRIHLQVSHHTKIPQKDTSTVNTVL